MTQSNQSELEQLDRIIIENQSYDGSIDISDQRSMRDEIVAYITANYTPNSSLKALLKESEKWNGRIQGTSNCKSCALQESLAELTEAMAASCKHNHTTVRSTENGGYYSDCIDCGSRLMPWSLVEKERADDPS